MPFQLIYLSQRDPRWKNIKLGSSNKFTIGTHGCALTCLSMLLSGFGYLETPDTLNIGLKQHGGFIKDELVWGAVSSLYPKIKYKNLHICQDTAAPVDVIGASIDAGQPVILQVDSSPRSGLQSHWVLAYAKASADFFILDPWAYPTEQGQEILLMSRYGQGKKLRRAISAATFYECQAAADGSVPTVPPALDDGSMYVRVRSQVPAGLRLRSAPNTASETLSIEYPGSYLKVIEPETSANPKIGVYDQWLHVRNSIGIEGYVAAWYVDGVKPASVPDVETVVKRVRPSVGDGLENVLTPAPVERRFKIAPGQTGSYHLMADTWNNYGGILSAMSSKLGFEPGVAVATLGVESGGQAFGPDGRLLIRFENHLFYYYWGKNNLEQFNKHFTFNTNRRWMGHMWRPDPKSAWIDLHASQAREWAAFTFARAIDESAAMQSISMGMPQIMGFNYAILGYASVQDMFTAFARDERNQVIGFFDFVQCVLPSAGAVKALQSKNFLQFATIYNGIGQAPTYAGLIKSSYNAFSKLHAALPV